MDRLLSASELFFIERGKRFIEFFLMEIMRKNNSVVYTLIILLEWICVKIRIPQTMWWFHLTHV
jgi:hypothetical protein